MESMHVIAPPSTVELQIFHSFSVSLIPMEVQLSKLENKNKIISLQSRPAVIFFSCF